MSIFSRLLEQEPLGQVKEVDTSRVIIHTSSIDKLKATRVGRLVAINGRPGEWLIGMVEKISRKFSDNIVAHLIEEENNLDEYFYEENLMKIILIGTFKDNDGINLNVFSRSILTLPDIGAECYCIENEILSNFMSSVTTIENTDKSLRIGRYALEGEAIAYVDGNRLFQKHCTLLGSTGSGKSWAVANIFEQITKLDNSNAILFDIHGEYRPLNFAKQLHVAGPQQITSPDEKTIFLPYWLLSHEELINMFLDRTDSNAPNQATMFTKLVLEEKIRFLRDIEREDLIDTITLDSPIPFSINNVISELIRLNEEMVPGAKKDSKKKGDYNGKFSRFINRLKAKLEDKRYGFIFSIPEEYYKLQYLNELINKFMTTGKEKDKNLGVKIIDFSEVPSDILPTIIALVARLVFNIQYWLFKDERHPILLICDEAHLYLPSREKARGSEHNAIDIFERIAKEGRKYGVALLIVSQRPSDVNKTILSQCNNFISLRLTNAEDQQVVKKLMPDSMGGLVESLPLLETGEAIIVGDAVILPTRVILDKPTYTPDSGTINFWTEWDKETVKNEIDKAVNNMIKQSKSSN